MARPVRRVPRHISAKEAWPEVLSQEGPRELTDLKREIGEEALMLAELELIIEDYQREKARLLRELASLKEGLLDLGEGTEGRGAEACGG